MSKPSNLKTYLENQMLEMLRHKWIKGVHLGKDPGESACREWIEKYAADYRKDFEKFFNEVIDLVVTNCKNKVSPEVRSCCTDEGLKQLALLFVVEFTNLWLMERIKPCPNQHASEV
jgi:hypothetical protein